MTDNLPSRVIHPAVAAGVEALASHPTCPHVVMVTVTQSARCDECTVGLVAQAVLRWVSEDLLPGGFDDTTTWLCKHGRSTTPDVGVVLADMAGDLLRVAGEIERAGGGCDR